MSFRVHSLKIAVGCDSINGKFSLFSSLVSNDAHQKGQVINICIGRILCKLRPPLLMEVANVMSRRDLNPPVATLLPPYRRGTFLDFHPAQLGKLTLRMTDIGPPLLREVANVMSRRDLNPPVHFVHFPPYRRGTILVLFSFLDLTF